MSSHDLTVPKGWTRGRKLVLLDIPGPRIAVTQEFEFEFNALAEPDYIGCITFDSNEDFGRFASWWYAETGTGDQ